MSPVRVEQIHVAVGLAVEGPHEIPHRGLLHPRAADVRDPVDEAVAELDELRSAILVSGDFNPISALTPRGAVLACVGAPGGAPRPGSSSAGGSRTTSGQGKISGRGEHRPGGTGEGVVSHWQPE